MHEAVSIVHGRRRGLTLPAGRGARCSADRRCTTVSNTWCSSASSQQPICPDQTATVSAVRADTCVPPPMSWWLSHGGRLSRAARLVAQPAARSASGHSSCNRFLSSTSSCHATTGTERSRSELPSSPSGAKIRSAIVADRRKSQETAERLRPRQQPPQQRKSPARNRSAAATPIGVHASHTLLLLKPSPQKPITVLRPSMFTIDLWSR